MFKNKTKKIKFQSSDILAEILPPQPASRFVPKWFRKMPGVVEGVESVKKCIPFNDSLISGYMIPLPTDVIWDSSNQRFIHNGKLMVNSDHHPSQTEYMDLPPEFNTQPHKWVNNWFIKTPPGYSTLFVHPLNRLDLPFFSASAIVDTDKHPIVINFPFFLRKDFDGVIPAGTPLIQAIPFKRDSWDSKVYDSLNVLDIDSEGESVYIENPPFSNYKRRWWVKKVFR